MIFKLLAGTYWIGDPCYAFPNDGPKSKEWDKIMDVYIDEGIFHCSVPNIEFWAGSTAFGDGLYIGTDGKEYPVDSGMLGIMTEETVQYLGNPRENLEDSGSFYTFDKPFLIEIGGYEFDFSAVTIFTGDYED